MSRSRQWSRGGGEENQLESHSVDHGVRPDHNTFTLHYHGTCSECHHFHRRVAFDVPVDDTKSSRFFCERCQHPIFGLGRTNTQITLASQDSFPLEDRGLDHSPTTELCNNRPSPRRNLQLVTSLHESAHPSPYGQLSAIKEQTSPAGPSTATAIHEEEPPAPKDYSIAPARSHTNTSRPSVTEISSQHHDQDDEQPGLSMILGYIYRMLEKSARMICGGSHHYRFSGFGLNLQLTLEYTGDYKHPDLPATEANVGSASPNANDRHLGPRLLEAEPLSAEPLNENYEWPPSSVNHPQSDQAESIDVPRGFQDHDRNIKAERLRSHRRDQTLRKQALQRKCDCTENCHCRHETSRSSSVDLMGLSGEPVARRRGRGSSLDSTPGRYLDGVGRPTTLSTDTDFSLPDLKSHPLSHLGSMFSARRGSSGENSSSASISRRLRQGLPTAQSDASSVSLHPRRPMLPQRSISASIISSSPTPSQYGSIVADVLRKVDATRRTRWCAAHPSTLAWLHDGNVNHGTIPTPAGEGDGLSAPDGAPFPRTISTPEQQLATLPDDQAAINGSSLSYPNSLQNNASTEVDEDNIVGRHDRTLSDGALLPARLDPPLTAL